MHCKAASPRLATNLHFALYSVKYWTFCRRLHHRHLFSSWFERSWRLRLRYLLFFMMYSECKDSSYHISIRGFSLSRVGEKFLDLTNETVTFKGVEERSMAEIKRTRWIHELDISVDIRDPFRPNIQLKATHHVYETSWNSVWLHVIQMNRCNLVHFEIPRAVRI
jgi:hypothetical protein